MEWELLGWVMGDCFRAEKIKINGKAGSPMLMHSQRGLHNNYEQLPKATEITTKLSTINKLSYFMFVTKMYCQFDSFQQ